MSRRVAVATLWLLLALLAPAAVGAQGPEAGIADVLDEAASRLDAGEIDAAIERLETLDGSDDGRWTEWVGSGDPEVRAATLREAANRLGARGTVLPADAAALREQVLARAEFQPVQPSLLQRFLTWLFWQIALRGGPGAGLVEIALVLLGAVAVVTIVLLFVRGLRGIFAGGDEETRVPGEAIPRHAGDAQQRAGEAARAGDYREAMRLMYLAALLHLDELGLIRFDRALTNHEVLDSLRNNPRLRAELAPVVSRFDQVWYGHAPFGAEEFERVREQIERLRQAGSGG